MTNKTVRHSFCDGKYEYVREPGFRAHVYRHGEEWRDVLGDGFILSMIHRIEELEGCLRDVRSQGTSGVCCCGDAMDGHPDPMSCGHSPRDMLEYHITCCLGDDITSDPIPEDETTF